ncbi:glycosyltransferase [Mucilaginibacter angelicae]|uniref:Glycosyltransferase n=1 Tax=Mucilaginibacter angelicae TaxID=869718 RepID=A0ABV6L565_9SPHI
MATCRVYLFTYKRHHLLPRAVNSLLSQSLKDWVCEVHNDCPGDDFPGNYVRSLNDERFIVKDHPLNLGGTASFNLAYQNIRERYISILEDDNWWEPDFLREMVRLMDRHPHLSMAWCNMNVWTELENNGWENTHSTVWPDQPEDLVFTRLHIKQAMGGLHSNGAMLLRGKDAAKCVIPDSCELSIIEGVRERAMAFPIYFHARALANFSRTRHTSRSGDALVWTSAQLLLLASFIMTAGDRQQAFKKCLAYYRGQKPSPVASFFLANLFLIKQPELYRQFTPADWLATGKWLLRNIFRLSFVRKYLDSNRDTYHYLLTNTRARYADPDDQNTN